MKFAIRGILAFVVSAWSSSAFAIDHPCHDLANKSDFNEMWPDEFTSLSQSMRPKPKGTYVKTNQYNLDEETRLKYLHNKYPMLAVVSLMKWDDFEYNADSEILSLKVKSTHYPKICSNGEYCSFLSGIYEKDSDLYQYYPTGAIRYNKIPPKLQFQIAPNEIENLTLTEKPNLVFILSLKYPFIENNNEQEMPIQLHCAALFSNVEQNLNDRDRLLHVWMPLNDTPQAQGNGDVWMPIDTQHQSLDNDAVEIDTRTNSIFDPKGCGLFDCSIASEEVWGNIKIGLDAKELSQFNSNNNISLADDFWCIVSPEQWPSGVSAYLNEQKKIDAIYIGQGSAIYSPSIQTGKGIKIGSNLKELKVAYPNFVREEKYSGGGGVMYIVRDSEGNDLRFLTDGDSPNDKIRAIGIGEYSLDEWDSCPDPI